MIRSFWNRFRPYTLAQQAVKLRSAQPDSNFKYHGGSWLVWRGKVQPHPLSERYTITIRYKLRNRPGVFVISPRLRSRNGQGIPHTFSGDELCLFRFKHLEWNGRMWIADTILPWTSLWLYYYEVWLATGEWLGGGEHPEGGQKSRKG